MGRPPRSPEAIAASTDRPAPTRNTITRHRVGLRGSGAAFSTHRNGDGEAYFARACRRGWEGLVAKRADSPYSATRSRDWVKLKCEQGQELVIGGYTAPQGARTDFGALLLGYHEAGALRYAGRVGTGFDRATLSRARTAVIARAACGAGAATSRSRSAGVSLTSDEAAMAMTIAGRGAGGRRR